MSANGPSGRTILIFARDRHGRPLLGATIEFALNGQPAGRVPSSEGRASIALPNRTDVVTVSATYGGKTQTRQLAQNQDNWTFHFDNIADWSIGALVSFIAGHVPLIVGLVLLAAGTTLAFVFGSPTTLQTRLIVAIASLGGGLIASHIPGMLKVDLNWGEKLTIGATGALGVFVILYFVVPAT